MRNIYFYLVVLLFPVISYAQSISVTRVREPIVGVFNSSDLDQLQDNQKIEQYNYNDGLGRLSQSVIKQFSNNKDLVSGKSYELNGIEPVHFLPFASNSNNGSFQSNWYNDLHQFYNFPTHSPDIPPTSYPMAERVSDKSPLNRLVEIGEVGESWQVATDHTLKIDYGTNSGTWVKKWIINPGGVVNDDGVYDAYSLYKVEEKDANGTIIIKYLDKANRPILTRAIANLKGSGTGLFSTDETGPILNGSPNATQHDIYTYFIYDKVGRLSYVLPPKAVQEMVSSGNYSFNENDQFFKQYVYAYRHDGKGRLTAKKVPGQNDWNYFVYNSQDKIILSQSPNLKQANEWIFYKYDVLGRVIMQGLYIDYTHLTVDDIQSFVDGLPLHKWEQRSSGNNSLFGYTNESFPDNSLLSSLDIVLTINYYDTYDFNIPSGHQFVPFGQTTENSHSTFGLLTGSLVNVIGQPTYLQSINYYDEEGRIIQRHKQHILNDWNIESTEYDFIGRPITDILQHFYNGQVLQIKTDNQYDHAGRITDIFKQVNNETVIHLVYNKYNDLGQLVKKSLHYDWAGTASYLQYIDYRYNSRGWLTNINNASLYNDGGITNEDDFDAFGEEIFYDQCDEGILNSDPSVIKAVPQNNGNISAVKWKLRSPNIDPDRRHQHMYSYRYDDLERMTAAYYASDDAVPNYIDHRDDPKNFDEIVDYDIMGNINHLKRNDLIGQIDDLTYTYNGNQLTNVTDAAATSRLYDFHTNPTGGTGYDYDPNGNLSKNFNKDQTLAYNYLNLLTGVSNGTTNLDITYDAIGNKLKQVSGSKVHYYMDGIEYEDLGTGAGPKFQLVLTEEGRIRPRRPFSIYPDLSRNYVYDYFLKDHSGNVRAILSEEQTRTDYNATMELQNSSAETQVFNNVDETRDNKLLVEPSDPNYSPDVKVSHLNSATGTTIGVSKALEVLQGDKVSINTKYFYQNFQVNNNVITITDLLNQLAAAFLYGSNSPAGQNLEAQQQWADKTFTNNPLVNNFLFNAFGSNTINDPAKPQAFLVYLFFDTDFKFYPVASGISQVQSPNTLGDLGVLNLQIPEHGFLYIYTNNNSSQRVDFNDMQIKHFSGVLLEENHYYPYGLLNESLSTGLSARGSNKYKYHSNEWITDAGINGYDFGARIQDPVLGRWFCVDPHAEKTYCWSPYRYGFCNPVFFGDANGMDEYDENCYDAWDDDRYYEYDYYDEQVMNDMASDPGWDYYYDESTLELLSSEWNDERERDGPVYFYGASRSDGNGNEGWSGKEGPAPSSPLNENFLNNMLNNSHQASSSTEPYQASFTVPRTPEAQSVIDRAAQAQELQNQIYADPTNLGNPGTSYLIGSDVADWTTAIDGAFALKNTISSTGGGYKYIYRAVTQGELDDIVASGKLRPDPSGKGYEGGKLFAPTFEEAGNFSKYLFNLGERATAKARTIVKVSVPNDVLKAAWKGPDGTIGNMIAIPLEQLDNLKIVKYYNFSPIVR
jgi:RHS repeat-associated protein